MEIPVVGIAAVVFLVLLRLFAARRVRARRGRFVWLMFVPTLFGGIVILWGSVQMFASAPTPVRWPSPTRTASPSPNAGSATVPQQSARS